MLEQKLKNPSRNEEVISQSKVDGDTRLNLGGKKIKLLFGVKNIKNVIQFRKYLQHQEEVVCGWHSGTPT